MPLLEKTPDDVLYFGRLQVPDRAMQFRLAQRAVFREFARLCGQYGYLLTLRVNGNNIVNNTMVADTFMDNIPRGDARFTVRLNRHRTDRQGVTLVAEFVFDTEYSPYSMIRGSQGGGYSDDIAGAMRSLATRLITDHGRIVEAELSEPGYAAWLQEQAAAPATPAPEPA